MASRRKNKVPKTRVKRAPTIAMGGVRYVTIREYAEMLRVSYSTVYRAVQRGETASVRIGKLERIPVQVGAAA